MEHNYLYINKIKISIILICKKVAKKLKFSKLITTINGYNYSIIVFNLNYIVIKVISIQEIKESVNGI